MDEHIAHIANQTQVAVVGVSDRKFGGAIYKTLKKRGYAVYAVHPIRESFDGDRCYRDLTAVPDEVTVAVVAVSPESAEQVVEDARSAGITHLWFQQGRDFSDAVTKAGAKGLHTVSGKCILMYAQPVTGIHAFHRFLAKLFGRL